MVYSSPKNPAQLQVYFTQPIWVPFMYTFLCSQGSIIVDFSIFGRMSQDAADDSIRNIADNERIVTMQTIRGSGSIRRTSGGGRFLICINLYKSIEEILSVNGSQVAKLKKSIPLILLP